MMSYPNYLPCSWNKKKNVEKNDFSVSNFLKSNVNTKITYGQFFQYYNKYKLSNSPTSKPIKI